MGLRGFLNPTGARRRRALSLSEAIEREREGRRGLVGIPPVSIEGESEEGPVLGPTHQDGVKGPEHVVASQDTDGLERARRIDDLTGSDRNSGPA